MSASLLLHRQNYLLYNLSSRQYLAVNPDGAAVLDRLLQGSTLEEVAAFLGRQYPGGEGIYRKIRAFAAELFLLGAMKDDCRPTHPLRPINTHRHLKTLFLESTRRCNLRCLHCYADAGKTAENELTTREICDLIDQAVDLGACHLNLTGGEPFLRDDLFRILAYAAGKPLSITVYTNGTLLNGARLNELAGIDYLSLHVSIDGASPETHDRFRGVPGAFRRTLEALKRIKKTSIPLLANIMLNPFNKDEIGKIITLLKNEGINRYIIDRCADTGRMGQQTQGITDTMFVNVLLKYNIIPDLPLLLPERPAPACGIASSMVFITAEGNICLCPSLTDRVSNSFYAGNLRHTALKNAWEEGEPFVRYANQHCSENDCRFSAYCNGGCRMRAYLDCGDLSAPDPVQCLFLERKRVPAT